MEINVSQIPFEGLVLAEGIDPKKLDLETEIIKFSRPIQAKAHISRITNAVSVSLELNALMAARCSRCLEDCETPFHKRIKLNYQVNNREQVIDLNPDIREEIILDYAIKPLCKPNCLGLCPKCGKNLNEGGCTCGTT